MGNDRKLQNISKFGYIVELNLKYFQNFHQMHNGYSIAPEKNVTDMLILHFKEFGITIEGAKI